MIERRKDVRTHRCRPHSSCTLKGGSTLDVSPALTANMKAFSLPYVSLVWVFKWPCFLFSITWKMSTRSFTSHWTCGRSLLSKSVNCKIGSERRSIQVHSQEHVTTLILQSKKAQEPWTLLRNIYIDSADDMKLNNKLKILNIKNCLQNKKRATSSRKMW